MTVTSKKILFVVTSHDRKGNKPSGYFLSEVTHPHQVLAAGGYEIDFVSPKGGKAPLDPDSFDLNDGANASFWNNPKLRTALENTKLPGEVRAEDYAAVYFAGGHGAMWDLPDDATISALTAKIYEQGGVVGAVCHGPAALTNVKLSNGNYLVKDLYVAAFTNDEEREVGLAEVVPFLLADRLMERGAHHEAAPNWQVKVCTSGHLVTGQNPASATRVGDAMLTLLQNRSQ